MFLVQEKVIFLGFLAKNASFLWGISLGSVNFSWRLTKVSIEDVSLLADVDISMITQTLQVFEYTEKQFKLSGKVENLQHLSFLSSLTSKLYKLD